MQSTSKKARKKSPFYFFLKHYKYNLQKIDNPDHILDDEVVMKKYGLKDKFANLTPEKKARYEQKSEDHNKNVKLEKQRLARGEPANMSNLSGNLTFDTTLMSFQGDEGDKSQDTKEEVTEEEQEQDDDDDDDDVVDVTVDVTVEDDDEEQEETSTSTTTKDFSSHVISTDENNNNYSTSLKTYNTKSLLISSSDTQNDDQNDDAKNGKVHRDRRPKKITLNADVSSTISTSSSIMGRPKIDLNFEVTDYQDKNIAKQTNTMFKNLQKEKTQNFQNKSTSKSIKRRDRSKNDKNSKDEDSKHTRPSDNKIQSNGKNDDENSEISDQIKTDSIDQSTISETASTKSVLTDYEDQPKSTTNETNYTSSSRSTATTSSCTISTSTTRSTRSFQSLASRNSRQTTASGISYSYLKNLTPTTQMIDQYENDADNGSTNSNAQSLASDDGSSIFNEFDRSGRPNRIHALDGNRNRIDTRIDIDRELAEYQNKHIQVLFDFFMKNEDKILDLKFPFIDFEFYYVQADHESGKPVCPAEVGFEVFTLRSGFDPRESYHSEIFPSWNLRCAFGLVQEYCQTRRINYLNLKMNDEEFEKDWRGPKKWRFLYKRLLKTFIIDDGALALFTKNRDHTIQCLKQIAERAGKTDHFLEVGKHAVTDYTNLITALMLFCQTKKPNFTIMPKWKIEKEFLNPKLERIFDMMRCHFHNDDGAGYQAKQCAKETCMKMGFTTWNLLKHLLFDTIKEWKTQKKDKLEKYVPIPGRHFPVCHSATAYNVDLQAEARYWVDNGSDESDDTVVARYSNVPTEEGSTLLSSAMPSSTSRRALQISQRGGHGRQFGSGQTISTTSSVSRESTAPSSSNRFPKRGGKR